MRTLDRMLRIIYKDINLFEFINKKYDTVSSNDRDTRYLDYFDLKSKQFRNIMIQKYLYVYPNNYSPDELELFLDEICLKIGAKSPKEYHSNSINIFLYVVDQLLFLNAGQLMVSFENLLEWNGFINKVDSNILIAAKLALEQKGNIDKGAHRVDHDNYRLSQILSKGISENHMHLKGSGYMTDMNWYEFSNSADIGNKKFEKILMNRSPLENTKELISFYKIKFIKMYLFSILEKESFYSKEKNFFDEREQDDMILDLNLMKKVISYTDLEEYEVLSSEKKEALEFWIDLYKIRYCTGYDEEKKYFLSERAFLRDLFVKFLKNNMDSFSLYLFNVYLLASSKFKMMFFQDNEGMGFEKFKYSEEIKDKLLSNYCNVSIFKTVFDKYYSEKNVRKIEFRIAPKRKISGYKKLIDDVRLADKEVREKLAIDDDNRIKYGFIIHYIKDKNEFNDEEGISRKEKMYAKLDTDSHALISFFNTYELSYESLDLKFEDGYRNKIIGIDAANYELNCRPENFGYCFRRQKSEIYCSHRLKFTFHVGEEFTTLANGLRAIDEVIEFLNFCRGDRLGHALALGLDVFKYFETKRHHVISSVEDYIDDIVWMKYFIEKQDIFELNENLCNQKYHVSNILSFLEHEFYKYFDIYYNFPEVYQTGYQRDQEHGSRFEYHNFYNKYSIYDYYCAYVLRGDYPEIYSDIHDIYLNLLKKNQYDADDFYSLVTSKYGEKLNSCNKNHREAFLNPKARDLFFKYHYSSRYKEMHKKKIDIDADDLYIESVRMVQFALRKKIYNLEVSIESNPTSNIKISSVFKYIDLPFFQINQLYKEDRPKYNLSTSINTDDSSIFQTDLSLEYAYVVASLMREGYDIEKIYEYIEYMRENSMIQSFVNDSII